MTHPYSFPQGAFTGTGDLFSALLLAWTDILGDDTADACSKVGALYCRSTVLVSHVGQVLKRMYSKVGVLY